MTVPDLVSLSRLAGARAAELDEGLTALGALYQAVDVHLAATAAGLALPCRRGCDACCRECVFLTPLEFSAVWRALEAQETEAVRRQIIDDGRRLYALHRRVIEALCEPPPAGAVDHFGLVQDLGFRCPILGPKGSCRAYSARELYARLFGQSFNEEGGVYGCHLSGAALCGKHVTLLRARSAALKLNTLPFTGRRQVFPYYLELLARHDPALFL
ncbi:MAG: hypothetical protein HY903_00005 [Deltaproteobacteria bacterium]|nr:hypothetical protein [Deltaproteobacteria bacterium]